MNPLEGITISRPSLNHPSLQSTRTGLLAPVVRPFLAAALALTTLAAAAVPARPALAEPPIVRVFLDTLPVEFDVPPAVVQGRTLVPFRAIAEALGAKVEWDQATQTAIARQDEVEVRVPLGSRVATRNGEALTLDVPAQVSDERILMPLRFFAEAFGCRVSWDQEAYAAVITSAPRAMEVLGFYALGDARTPSWPDVFGTAYPETTTGHTDLLRTLALGWYSLDQQGHLLTSSVTGWQRPEGWEKVLQAAARYGLKTEMVVHLTDGRGELSALLKDEEAMKLAIAAVVAEAAGYGGVNLDLEGLGYHEQGGELEATRQRLNHFVEPLAAELAKAGRSLTLTLHPPNSAYPGYDYATLGRLANRVVIMAYSYGPKPEPLDLVRQAVELAVAEVPADKLLLGLSADSETPASLVVKVGLAKRYGLGGIALWRLGIISDAAWSALRSTIRPR